MPCAGGVTRAGRHAGRGDAGTLTYIGKVGRLRPTSMHRAGRVGCHGRAMQVEQATTERAREHMVAFINSIFV